MKNNFNKTFYYDPKLNFKRTYGELLNDICGKTSYQNVVFNDNYQFYLQLIRSLILDIPFNAFDSSLSNEESIFQCPSFSSDEKFLNSILNARKWEISMQTSGTTGSPKSVTHRFDNFLRMIKRGENYRDDIWGLAYYPNKMAGLQVFFQALLNFNILVNIFGLSKDEILNEIENSNITRLSATPTFYRMLLPANKQYHRIKSVTFGGERLDQGLKNKLSALFPYAKFSNIYASTEVGPMFVSKDDIFQIPEELSGLVRIVNNELFFHYSVVGLSDDLKSENSWFASGDIVSVLSEEENTFKIVSRKDDIINVGGAKVNPSEIEDALLSIDSVIDARVFEKRNSVNGSIVVAEVICSDKSMSEFDIIQNLRSILTEYKIPRILYFVNSIKKNQSGKKDRR